ncbi:MAG: S8 family serine peptidase [Acidobacteriota bacterium]
MPSKRAAWIGMFWALYTIRGGSDEGAKVWREKIFPEDRRAEVKVDGAYEVIVLAEAGQVAAAESAVRQHGSAPFPGGIQRARLELIEGIAAKASGAGIKALAESKGIARIWMVPRDLFENYVRIIQGLGYVVATDPGPGPINLSLGPPSGMLPMPFQEGEPLNLATRRAAAAGKLTIVSAGNDGPKPDTLNPWCLADWVLCVGAAAVVSQKAVPWEKSSRGRPRDSRYRPGVLALGVDVLTTHPSAVPKTEEMKAAERRVGFDRMVAPEKRSAYTIVSGTSFATPDVSKSAAQIVFFLQKALAVAEEEKDKAEPTMATLYTHFRLAERDELVRTKRFAGTIKDVGGAVVAIYPLRPDDPLVVKQILLDAAIPMPGFGTNEVGSGLVTSDHIAKLFGKFGLWDPKLLPVKVID